MCLGYNETQYTNVMPCACRMAHMYTLAPGCHIAVFWQTHPHGIAL